jgi:nucleoid-associated protein YejK
MFGSDICYDEQTGQLLIKKIPKSLRQQLARHIKEPGHS